MRLPRSLFAGAAVTAAASQPVPVSVAALAASACAADAHREAPPYQPGGPGPAFWGDQLDASNGSCDSAGGQLGEAAEAELHSFIQVEATLGSGTLDGHVPARTPAESAPDAARGRGSGRPPRSSRRSWRSLPSVLQRLGASVGHEPPSQPPFDSSFPEFDSLPIGAGPVGTSEELKEGYPWFGLPSVTRRSPYVRKPARADLVRFFQCAQAFEWTFFIIMLYAFFYIQWSLMDWPSKRKYHGLALLIWLGAAGFYDFVVWGRLGATQGQSWLVGYILELIFSMENIFIFHIVARAFRIPYRQSIKALTIVIIFQMVFQLVFFMGLAKVLSDLGVLPYLLGFWLIYVGYGTLQGEDHDVDFSPEDLAVFQAFKCCLGNRLGHDYSPTGNILVRGPDGRWCITLLGPATACLCLVDFVMEIDVTLTKIEEIPNHYVAFTSSVAAGFALPELYFVATDAFQKYKLLQYGISFVLFLFGFELLFKEVWPVWEMVNVMLITAVMVLCILLSKWLGYTEPDVKTATGEAEGGVEDGGYYYGGPVPAPVNPLSGRYAMGPPSSQSAPAIFCPPDPSDG